jgi:hypothetical protein
MIPNEMLILLASCYEQYMYDEHPTPQARRAKLLFDSECRRLYDAEPPSLRNQMSFEKYVAAAVIPDVLRQLQSPPRPPNI